MALELTKCVPPGQNGNPWLRSIVAGLGFGSVWAFVWSLMGVGIWGIVTAGLAGVAYGALAAFCDFFYNARLVCIAPSDVLVGMVRFQEDSFDGDWTVNVIPAPFLPPSSLGEMQDPAAPQHRFFTNQHPAFYSDFKGFNIRDVTQTPLIHNEIEGTKMQTWCAATLAALAAAAVLGPIIVAACGLLCLIILIIVVAIISWIGHEVGDTGSVTDVATDPEAQTIKSGDSTPVAIEGRFIFDPEHDGYNELHAVRSIVTVSQEDHDNFDNDRGKKIKDKVDEAKDHRTRGKGKKKGHAVHPKLG